MPSVARSTKHPGLTRRQAAFAREFVLNGGRRKDAALAAGYSTTNANALAVEANRLLRNPAVIDAVRKESEGALHANVALGQHVLADLAERAVSETVRLAAAQALLDRGGMQIIKKTETTVTVQDNRTDAELLQHARRLASSLGLDARTIDGAGLVRDAAPALPMAAQEGPFLPDISKTRGAGGGISTLDSPRGIESPAAKNLAPLEILEGNR